MQTFLPYPDFPESAAVLDRQRLGKQRVEVIQILNALLGLSLGWQNHPAVKMWRGHEEALAAYGLAVCDEWTARGYKDTCKDKILVLVSPRPDFTLPSWFGDEQFHHAHKSNLIRKNPEFYGPIWPFVSADWPYIWPTPK